MLQPNSLLIAALIGFIITSTTGCKKAIESISNDELRLKYSDCYDMNEPAAAMIMACNNYKSECDRRSKDIGRFIC